MSSFLIRSLCRAVSLTACLSWLSVTDSQAWATELTADEVLERSKHAMKPPIRYRVITNGISSILQQKALNDGTTATRLESSFPVRTALYLANESYEFYPDHGAGIDTSFIQRSAVTRAASLNEAMAGRTSTALGLKMVTLPNRQECYELIKTFSPDLLDSMIRTTVDSGAIRLRAQLPLEERTLIDKSTFHIISVRVLSTTGSTISESQYRDVEHPVNLADDLFLPPDGIELLHPRDWQEYFGMVTAMLKPDITLAARQRTLLAPGRYTAKPSLRGALVINERTGHYMPPLASVSSPHERYSPPTLEKHTSGQMSEIEETVRRSIRAMAPPIRYMVVCNGTKYIVSQKLSHDSTLMTRLETSSQPPMYQIVLTGSVWEIYPGHATGFDLSHMEASFSSQIPAIPWHLRSDELDVARSKDIALKNGTRAIEVTVPYPAQVSKIIENAMPTTRRNDVRIPAPAHVRAIFDRATYEVIEAALISRDGSILSQLSFHDIEHDADLSDKLFIPPTNGHFYSPHNQAEYFATLKEALNGPMTSIGAIFDSRPLIEAATGRLFVPLRLGSARVEFERRVESKRNEARSLLARASRDIAAYGKSHAATNRAKDMDASTEHRVLSVSTVASNSKKDNGAGVYAIGALSIAMIVGACLFRFKQLATRHHKRIECSSHRVIYMKGGRVNRRISK